MNEHLISVIIPVYNTAEYLPRCLDSILNNTYRNLEVICINDGSKDSSLEVLSGYAAQDSRVKVIDQENAGVSAARNRGLDEATGEYIAFVDSDDWVHRQYFEVLLTGAFAHGADLAVCGITQVSVPVQDALLTPVEYRFQCMTAEQLAADDISACAKLYRRSLVGEIRFSRKIMLAEDTMFNLDVLYQEAEPVIVKTDAPLYYYWMARQDSLMHTLDDRNLLGLIDYYLSHLDSAPTLAVKNMFLTSAMKTLFLLRYRARLMDLPLEKTWLKGQLNCAVSALKKTEGIGVGKKLVFTMMARFPFLYRLFRIVSDPTILTWERQVRADKELKKWKKS